MSDRRAKDNEWLMPQETSWEKAKLAVLMDLRDELKKLNSLLYCSNFLAIPEMLRDIRRNTTKRKRRKP